MFEKLSPWTHHCQDCIELRAEVRQQQEQMDRMQDAYDKIVARWTEDLGRVKKLNRRLELLKETDD